jgi:hypothetical protein
LEPIIMLAPFSKKPLALTLRGITTDDKDLSVRLYQTCLCVHLTHCPQGRFNTHRYSPSLRAVWNCRWAGTQSKRAIHPRLSVCSQISQD